MEASASEPECSGDELSRLIFMSAKTILSLCIYARLHTADRFARFAQLRRARTCSATGSPYSWLKPCFSDIPGKNDPHIRVLAAFPGAGWDKLSGKKQLDLKGLTSQ